MWVASVPILRPAALCSQAERDAGVGDIEGLAVRAADDYLRAVRAVLTEDDRQDLIAFLIEQAWIEAQRYDREIGTLRGYLYRRLKWRTTDWYRKRFGDRRRHLDTVSVPLDDARALATPEPEVDDLAGFVESLDLDYIDAWTMEQLAIPLSLGWKLSELAKVNGITLAKAEVLLDGLRDTIGQ